MGLADSSAERQLGQHRDHPHSKLARIVRPTIVARPVTVDCWVSEQQKACAGLFDGPNWASFKPARTPEEPRGEPVSPFQDPHGSVGSASPKSLSPPRTPSRPVERSSLSVARRIRPFISSHAEIGPRRLDTAWLREKADDEVRQEAGSGRPHVDANLTQLAFHATKASEAASSGVLRY
jgi:hypothetical protein